MAKWTRISLSLLTLLTAIFIIIGALLPTFVKKIGSTNNTVGLLKTCSSNGNAFLGATKLNAHEGSLESSLGLHCIDNDKMGDDTISGFRRLGTQMKQNFKGLFNKEDTIQHTYQPRPTAEKVSVGFLCTAGVLTILIGFFTMWPSMTISAYSYMISPIVLHVIGMSLAIWTGIERSKAYGFDSRSVGAGLALQIVSLIMLIVLAGLWTLPSARKTVVNKYTA